MMTVPKIEMHLAHACNLRCEGCTHYSNYALAGVTAFAEGGPWLEGWSGRIAPINLSFLGGEPLLNGELPAFLRLARELWPQVRLRLVTNGLLLARWRALWPVLAETAATLTISIHSREARYLAEMNPILQQARDQAAALGVRYEERNSVDGWYKLYRGQEGLMEPYDEGDPRASWKACRTKHCVTLQDNALWKCPPLAHLPRIAAKLGLADRPAWQPYLRYRPLLLEASDDEIRGFLARGPESSCGMCPTRLEYFEKSVY